MVLCEFVVANELGQNLKHTEVGILCQLSQPGLTEFIKCPGRIG